MEEGSSNNGGATDGSSYIQQPHHQPLPASSSSKSVYESCVSQQSPVHTASSPSTLTSTGSTISQKSPFVTCEDHDKDTHGTESRESGGGNDVESPEGQEGKAVATVVTKLASRIPVLRLVKSPLPSQRLSSPKSPTPASPRDSLATSPMDAPPLATTYVKGKKQLLDSTHTKGTPTLLINRDSPAGPLDATYRVSPMGVPYLSKGHTPNTIRQLQEKLRSQTKGKLISLQELRNARSAFYVCVCIIL